MFDLLCGVGPKHIRMLCESSWDHGGYGYTPEEVGRLTLDQIFMLLGDRKVLRAGGKRRTMKAEAVKTTDDGHVMGRDKDGKPIKGRIAGKSLARQLMEKEEAKKKKAARRERRRKRRKKQQV